MAYLESLQNNERILNVTVEFMIRSRADMAPPVCFGDKHRSTSFLSKLFRIYRILRRRTGNFKMNVTIQYTVLFQVRIELFRLH